MKEFVLQDDFDLSRATIDYKQELNEEQLDVVLHGDGPCLVLAGAGSGKTRTITYRVAYLLEKGVSPEHILLVTFTNKAAKEMLARVEGLLGYYPKGLWGGTFHSIANRLLRMYASELGYSPTFTILDSEDSKSLIKVCVKALNVDTKARRFPSPAKLHGMISYARNSARSLTEVIENRYPNFIELSSVVERIAELYAARKQEADAMDFDDLLLKLRELLSTNQRVLQRLATQFQYILVDEYQDTNVVQADIVRMLATVNENLLVVGDDAQSIYSFRAADIQNILGFPQMYAQTQTFKLTTNYRSTPEILAIANASIQQNSNQFAKELGSVSDSMEKPSLVPANNASQEAQYISQQILALRDDGVPLHEIAVLFRAAFHSQALEFELMKRDIPYEYRGGLKFFERAHVKDIVSYVRVKMNPKDEVAWMRILGLLPGVGLVTAQKIIGQIRGAASLAEVLTIPVKVGKRAAGGWAMLTKTLEKMSREELPADVIRTVTAGDYRDYLEAEYPDFMDRLEDLEQFALFAEGYDSLQVFLDEVSLTSDYGATRQQGGHEDEERIVLSTIHQAKGLEWDCVFVMHLVDGKFPNARALDERDGLEEERRLFYVATTRARKQLFFTYPITVGYDTLQLSQPSVFLQELPDALFEQVRLTQSRPVASRTAYASSYDSAWADDEPTIVFDDMGERVTKEIPKGMSFLRDIDEL
jgi:DNA helicase-2/ATP-dependent DNA helicase PcrA